MLVMQQFVLQLPLLLGCLAGVLMVISRWREAPKAAPWALAGLLLPVILCVLIPVVHVVFLQLSPHMPRPMMKLYGFNPLFWNVLRAASYLLLVTAIFTGRKQFSLAPAARQNEQSAVPPVQHGP